MVEIIAVGVLACALFLAGTAEIPILGLDEGRFSQAAREMVHRGDLVVPTFHGEGRYHKPILIYWCTMASYSVFGVNERAARLPSIVAGTLTVMLLAWTARRRFGAGAGLLAGMLLAVTVTFHVQAKACTADMVLLLPTLAAMLAFEAIVAGSGDWRSALVLWLGLGLAILAKGPIAPAWIGATALALWAFDSHWQPWQMAAFAALLLAGAWSLGPAVLVVPAGLALRDLLRSPTGRRVVRDMRWRWGFPLLALVVMPWVIMVEWATGGAFLREALGTHVVSRSVTSFESHGFFPGFYLVTAPLVAFPWFVFSVDAARRGSAAVGVATARYLVAWLVGPLVLLELVQTKLVHYWLPSYPAGVLLVVAWVSAAGPRGWTTGRWSRTLLLIAGLVVSAVPLAVVRLMHVPRLWLAAAIASAVLAGATVAVVVAGWRRPVRAVSGTTAATAVFLALVFGWLMPDLATESLPPRAARRTAELLQPGDRVVVFKGRDDDLFFYLPVDTRACQRLECLAAISAAGEDVLVLARSRDFEILQDEWPEASLEEVDRIGGLDLNRARRDEIVVFRVRWDEPAALRGVDTRQAPS